MHQLPIDFEEDKVVDDMQRQIHGPKFSQIFSGAPPTGDELKEEGTNKALSKEASQIYRDKLVDTLKVFPAGRRITVEQLTGIVGRPPEGVSVNAVGAAVNFMAKRGMIRKTGKMLKPGRKERHSNLIPEWEVVRYD